ncbi:MAG TPA: TetR/AcrR family transcriptional regulator [Ramlibacter sp.]|uniref:TetR/AcrR family transcriptional regulator n=1 Tax=Ramlibacter sp. TaxID=1917967 RepID=UPI002C92EC3E|nr:TetR/AcrR family transcriptional regulator [Ramlibacter sp.]HVZ46495.1 TetR/AcrR family transcriptional regulator [Ramlibacter sp.]
MKGEVLRRAILETAVTLFIQRGTAGTSIQDIAESLGLTRTAVYYYFRKKEDILQALSEEVTLSARRIGASVMARGDFDVVATLRDLVQQHAAVIMSHPQGFRVIERNERELSDEHVRAAQGARRAIFENFRAVIERGISSGRFRVVDADVAAFALIGMCNWTAWWFQPGGRMKAEEVSGAIADMAVHALMREDARVARTPDVWESFRLLREDLSYLERQLKVISKS